MAEIWQTIEQAGVTLGLSVRTINRHITAGKLESRLFEGRREVLVQPMADVTPAVNPPTASAATPPSDNGFAPTQSSTSSATASSDFSQQRSANGSGAEETPNFQSMLALADSIDDKATLAVAAYQTLARAAEMQVQSLRRAAFGAWAAVALLAIGAIVGVGWGTYRLTSAEVSANLLQKQAIEQRERFGQLSSERETLRDNYIATLTEASALKGRLTEISDQAKQSQASAERANMALRELMASGNLRPVSQPTTNATLIVQLPTATPAPASQSTSLPTDHPELAMSVIPVTLPSTSPTSRPTSNQSPRPTYLMNSNGELDAR